MKDNVAKVIELNMDKIRVLAQKHGFDSIQLKEIFDAPNEDTESLDLGSAIAAAAGQASFLVQFKNFNDADFAGLGHDIELLVGFNVSFTFKPLTFQDSMAAHTSVCQSTNISDPQSFWQKIRQFLFKRKQH